jgi:hypothetical protein
MKDHVPRQQKTEGNTIAPQILIFIFLDSTLENKIFRLHVFNKFLIFPRL